MFWLKNKKMNFWVRTLTRGLILYIRETGHTMFFSRSSTILVQTDKRLAFWRPSSSFIGQNPYQGEEFDNNNLYLKFDTNKMIND